MKTIKILVLLSIIGGFFYWNAYASTIEKLEALDNNTVQLTASSDVVFSDVKVEGDIKLLKDVSVSFSSKDRVNSRKVLINLSNNLITNTSYSLITVLWGEWNIDFKISDTISWEFSNTGFLEWEKWVEKINIIDPKTLELYYNYDLTEWTFEYKILSEIELSGLSSTWNNVLDIEIAKSIESSSNYIVMILSLKDALWKTVNLKEDLYDLFTSDDLVQAVSDQVVGNEIVTETWNLEQTNTDSWNIEEVAMKIKQTPETGTTTSILIIIAMLAGFGLFFRKRFVR